MIRTVTRGIGAGLFGACFLAALALPAAAHEQRDMAGYHVVVGWADEPAYTGFKNAVQIRVSDAATKAPTVDIAPGDLKVEVMFGDASSEKLAVDPAFRVGAFGEPGDYQADLIPSRPGEYTFHLTGTIQGKAIDEKFTCGEKTFDCPQRPTEVAFPAKDPSIDELASRIERVDSRVEDAKDDEGLGMKLGIAGVALGAIALGVAIFARSKSKA